MKRDDKRYDVVVIPGDGIGPELTEAALGVLRAQANGFEQLRGEARHPADGLKIVALHLDDNHVDDRLVIALAQFLCALGRVPGGVFHRCPEPGGSGGQLEGWRAIRR